MVRLPRDTESHGAVMRDERYFCQAHTRGMETRMYGTRRCSDILAEIGTKLDKRLDEGEEYERRIILACAMLDRILDYYRFPVIRVPSPGSIEAELRQLRQVLDEGARPDLEPDDEPDGTLRDGLRSFRGGKP